MLFNSIAFAIFLPVVFAIYWSLNRGPLKLQNFFLLTASYVFYGYWDWRFLALLFSSSTVDFVIGRLLSKEARPPRRKLLLVCALVWNIGVLGFFKYHNFFVTSVASLLESIGFHADVYTLNVILPVGLSFYTFQSLSYSIEVYRGTMKPASDPVAFFAFVAFFPQLVAGPIERARTFLPQFIQRRQFVDSSARDGLRQMAWGFFKKIVIADNLSGHVEYIFSHYAQLDGLTLGLGAFFFAIQIYCDFSGYSDIALGTARLFGFSMMRNFAFPYFSRDIGEFWRRWHISLSSWFRDYVFYPLGGGLGSRWIAMRNTLITFTLSGLWHGANWTFVVWGFFHGLLYFPVVFGFQKTHMLKMAKNRILPNFREAALVAMTFSLVTVGWVFFRSRTLGDAFGYLNRAVRHLHLVDLDHSVYYVPLFAAAALLIVEWIQRQKEHALQIEKFPVGVRWATYYAVIFLIITTGNFGQQSFIYFQF